MTEFTKEQLLNIECDWTDPRGEVARFALALLERAENAEAERDRLGKELEEAEKALREADFFIGGARISDVDRCAFRQMPAVRRARERGGRG